MFPSRVKFLLEVAALVFSGLAILTLFFLWRVASGPVRLDVLCPIIESRISDRTNLEVSIGRIAVGAHDFSGPFLAEASGITLTLPNQAGKVTVGDLRIALSLRQLAHGRIRPIWLTVNHPVAHLMPVHPKAQAADTQQPSGNDPIEELLRPDENDPLALWNVVTLENGEIDMADPTGQTVSSISGIEGQIKRLPAGASARLVGTVSPQGGDGLLSFTAQYDEGGRGTVQFHTDALPINILASLSPSLAAIGGVQVPVAISGGGTFQGEHPIDVKAKVSIGQGTIVDTSRFPSPIAVKGGGLSASYSEDQKMARIDDVQVDFDGFSFTGNAMASLGGDSQLTANAIVTDLHIDDFNKYWPTDLAQGGRRWVTSNLSKGIVDQATLRLTGSMPQGNIANATIGAVNGTLHVTGATIHYFGKVPDVQQASASIDYDMKSMTIHMLGGDAAGLDISGGTILISGFDKPDQYMNIDIGIKGTLVAALKLLDADPLHYAKKLDLSPAMISGSADTQLHLDFPLIDNLQSDQMNVRSDSQLQDAGIQKIVHSLDLSNLDGQLWVGQGGLTVSGRGQIAGVPADLIWNQDFDRKAHLQSEAYLSGDLDDAQRARLGLAIPQRLSDVVGVKGHYQDFGASARLEVDANLKQADFRIDEIGYEKPPGQSGRAAMTLNLQHGVLTRIDDIDIHARDLSAKGFVELTPEGKLSHLHVQPFKVDNSDVVLDVLQTPAGSHIDLSGSIFDARNLLHKPKDPARQTAPTAIDNAPPLEIDTDIGWVQTSEDDGLRNFKGQLVIANKKWQRAELSTDARGHVFALHYVPDDGPNPGYTLTADTDNLGTVLTSLDETDSIQGGSFHLEGRRQPATDDTPFPPLTGSFKLDQFRVINPPIFAQLFNLLSVQGFMEELKGQGIQFDRLTGKYELQGDQLQIADGKLESSAIGLTVQGNYDRSTNKLDLQGVAVPAYGINTFLNNVPVLGALFTGGDGQGVFSTTYTITGTVEKPSVFINPASIFAPGMLRTLFFELPFGHTQSNDIPG